VTRIQHVLFLALALASFAGLFAAAGGRERRVVLLLWLVAWCLLAAPVAALEFSSRTAVPAFGFLGASAAVGGLAAARAWRARKTRAPSRRTGLQPESAV
jgi:hypothetical protein